MDRQAGGDREALDGGGGESARRRGGLPDPAAWRHCGRRGDCRATRAGAGRAAVLGHRRRRVSAAARCARAAARRVRRPRDRAGRRKTRPLPEGRQAARILRRRGRRQGGRRSRNACGCWRSRIASMAGSSGRALFEPAIALAERGFPVVAAPACGDRQRTLPDAAAIARLFLRRQRQGAARRARCCAIRPMRRRCARSPHGGADAFYSGRDRARHRRNRDGAIHGTRAT